jgi:hypothetical protein
VVVALCLGAARNDPPSTEQVLDEALRKRTAIDTLRQFSMTLRSPTGRTETRRAAVATKEYEGVLYVLGVFSYPQGVRGTAFLTIDDTKSSEYFIYFPAFHRVRRVTAYQKSDPWFGTDLSIEDIERRRASDYEIIGSSPSEVAGEAALEIVARPLYDSQFERIRFTVAARDQILLRTDYYRTGRETPSKTIEASREGMVVQNGAAVPKRLVCTNFDLNTQTEVNLEGVEFSPEIQQQFFSARSLELRSKLKFLE